MREGQGAKESEREEGRIGEKEGGRIGKREVGRVQEREGVWRVNSCLPMSTCNRNLP